MRKKSPIEELRGRQAASQRQARIRKYQEQFAVMRRNLGKIGQ